MCQPTMMEHDANSQLYVHTVDCEYYCVINRIINYCQILLNLVSTTETIPEFNLLPYNMRNATIYDETLKLIPKILS